MNTFASSIYQATKAYVPTVQLNISLPRKDFHYGGSKDKVSASPDSKSSSGALITSSVVTEETSLKSSSTIVSSSTSTDIESTQQNNDNSYNSLLEENDMIRSELYRLQRQMRVTESENSLCTKRNTSLDVINNNNIINNNCGFSDDLHTSNDNCDNGSEYSNDWKAYSNLSVADISDINSNKLLDVIDNIGETVTYDNDSDNDSDNDDDNDERHSTTSDRDSLNKTTYIRKLLNRVTDFEEEIALLNDQLSKVVDKDTAMQAEINRLFEQVKQLEYDKAQMAAELLQLVPLQLKANEMKAAISAYRNSLSDKEALVKENLHLKNQVSKLTSKNEASRKEVQLLTANASAFVELQSRYQRLEVELQSMHVSNDKLRDKADQAFSEKNHYEQKCNSLQREVLTMSSAIKGTEQKILVLESTVAEREGEIALLTEQCASRSRNSLSSCKSLSSCGQGELGGSPLMSEGWTIFSCASAKLYEQASAAMPSSPKKKRR